MPAPRRKIEAADMVVWLVPAAEHLLGQALPASGEALVHLADRHLPGHSCPYCQDPDPEFEQLVDDVLWEHPVPGDDDPPPFTD